MIYLEYIPSTDPRLKRHIKHDSRSRDYEFDTSELSITSVQHVRRIPVLDQGQVGSCTGNAGIGCLGTDPYYATLSGGRRGAPAAVVTGKKTYSLDEAGALALYSDAELLDGDGPYPPMDNGSTGLSVATVLKGAGEIAGYRHTFSLEAALKALSVTSFITGLNWYQNMFSPTPEGVVSLGGSLAGGHEIVVDSYDASRALVGFTNSWGSTWGAGGRFFMAAEDYGTLLSQQGDVTVFVPVAAPVPTPLPGPDDPDGVFADALRPWVQHTHVGANAVVKRAAQTWLKAKGLS